MNFIYILSHAVHLLGGIVVILETFFLHIDPILSFALHKVKSTSAEVVLFIMIGFWERRFLKTGEIYVVSSL